MRIVIPVFDFSTQNSQLALAQIDNTTLLGRTISALISFQLTDIIVGSDNPKVLVEAARHGVKVLLQEKPDLTERYLIPGAMGMLRTLPEVPVPTAVLWHGFSELKNDFLIRLSQVSFRDGIKLALTVALSKDHPCQLSESVNLLAAGVYFPLHIDPSLKDVLVSPSFCFEWPANTNGPGMLFIRNATPSGSHFTTTSLSPEHWSADGVMEYLGCKEARIVLPLSGNTIKNYTLSAATLDRRLSPLIRIWRHGINGRSFLAVNSSIALQSAYSVKLWRIDQGDLLPLAQSGIAIDQAGVADAFNHGGVKWWLFSMPEIESPCTLSLWLVQQHAEGSGLANVLLPWESEKGGFVRDINDGPISTKEGSPILGRQGFPPIYEFDSLAALFAPGSLPKQEPKISPESVVSIIQHPTHCHPVKNRIDLLRLRTGLRIEGRPEP